MDRLGIDRRIIIAFLSVIVALGVFVSYKAWDTNHLSHQAIEAQERLIPDYQERNRIADERQIKMLNLLNEISTKLDLVKVRIEDKSEK